VAVCATLIGAAALAAPAAAEPPPAPAAEVASPEMMTALQRDLGLTADEALARLAKEDAAARTEQKLRADLGAHFGGAWLTADDQQLVIAITDAGEAPQVRAAGATPRLVAHSERQLTSAKDTLDRATAPAGVPGWYVDVTTSRVVVLAQPSAVDAAADFVAASGADTDAVRVEATSERPQPLYDVRGGDAYFPGANRCSVGFSVNGGFVTAGHCGVPGTTTSGYNQVAQGTVAGSTFPGRDYAWVAVNSNWTPTPRVNRYSGNLTVTVAGSQEAPVGASVCRSGSTTGWHCGSIEAKNATVNYPQGSVQGLTRTNACAEPGDSGGSWLTGEQAQGVTSGGSGNCTIGGIVYFQPLLPILAAYGLTLVTAGGSPPPQYTVPRSATTQAGGSSHSAARGNGLSANKAKILAVGIDCTAWSSSYKNVWSAPDSSWYIVDETTNGLCTN
jgi:streptogrisin C